MAENEVQLATCIDKFDPGNQALIKGARSSLRNEFSDCAELVWDNCNFFVIGYSPTERPSDYIVSIAASAKGVSLSFNGGADLPDPDQILEGSAKIKRFIKVTSVDVLDRQNVRRILTIAREHSAIPRPWRSGGKLIIRSISAKQRPRHRN